MEQNNFPRIPEETLALLIDYNEAADAVAKAQTSLNRAKSEARRRLELLLEKLPVHLHPLLSKLPTTTDRAAATPLPLSSDSEDNELANLLDSPEFGRARFVKEGYLLILAEAHKRAPDCFEKALVQLRLGRSRKYISREKEELLASGTSVRAQQIPGTTYWADTCNDTDQKVKITEQILKKMDYSAGAINAASAALQKLASTGFRNAVRLTSRAKKTAEEEIFS